jgi:hypothetical protein
MVEIDVHSAETRIQAMKSTLQAREAVLTDPKRIEAEKSNIAKLAELSKGLTAAEAQVETSQKEQEQATLQELSATKLNSDDLKATIQEEDNRGRILGQDSEYQKLLGVKDKQELIDYLSMNYAENVDSKMRVENIRAIALQKRTERVFESK